jgi:hypothetical protein
MRVTYDRVMDRGLSSIKQDGFVAIFPYSLFSLVLGVFPLASRAILSLLWHMQIFYGLLWWEASYENSVEIFM